MSNVNGHIWRAKERAELKEVNQTRAYFELDFEKSIRNSVTIECSYTSYSCVLLQQLICL